MSTPSITRARYALELAATMGVLTALALAVIRVSCVRALGPDPDPNGVCMHFAIDLFGMAVHLAVAVGVVAVVRRRTCNWPVGRT